MVGTLLALTALPDAMVVPLLEELLVVRYGVGPGAAHAFLSVNLVGGLCAVPLLGLAARRRRPILAVAVASVADAVLLGAMWLPIGFTATIVLVGILPWYFLSELKFLADMGLLLVMIMLINMVIALCVLPLLVYLVKPKFVEREHLIISENVDISEMMAAHDAEAKT